MMRPLLLSREEAKQVVKGRTAIARTVVMAATGAEIVEIVEIATIGTTVTIAMTAMIATIVGTEVAAASRGTMEASIWIGGSVRMGDVGETWGRLS
jgi:hypothetical protein